MEALTNLITAKMVAYFLTLLAGALASQLLELLLPERVRVSLVLRKKWLSKWLKNPAYVLGIASLLNLRTTSPLETVRATTLRALAEKHITQTGTEIHFHDAIGGAQLVTKVQFAYDDDPKTGHLDVESLNVTVEAAVRYRQLRNRIEDLRGLLAETETKAASDNKWPRVNALRDKLHRTSGKRDHTPQAGRKKRQFVHLFPDTAKANSRPERVSVQTRLVCRSRATRGVLGMARKPPSAADHGEDSRRRRRIRVLREAADDREHDQLGHDRLVQGDLDARRIVLERSLSSNRVRADVGDQDKAGFWSLRRERVFT
jgi:hypothetical protein